MVPAFTSPWFALDWIGAARTLVRETQEVRWCAKTTAGSSLRVWCPGAADAHLQENMACTPESDT